MQQATILLLPALNQMIDITTTRTMATRVHPPEVTYVLLFALTVASGLLDQAGLDEAERRYERLMALGEALLNLAGDFKSTFLEAAAIARRHGWGEREAQGVIGATSWFDLEAMGSQGQRREVEQALAALPAGDSAARCSRGSPAFSRCPSIRPRRRCSRKRRWRWRVACAAPWSFRWRSARGFAPSWAQRESRSATRTAASKSTSCSAPAIPGKRCWRPATWPI